MGARTGINRTRQKNFLATSPSRAPSDYVPNVYWFLTDETNKPPKAGSFFVYGGVVVDADRALDLHRKIGAIRATFGIPLEGDFKFSNQKGPDPGTHAQAKVEALQAMSDFGAKLIAVVVHQRVLSRQSEAAYTSMALNVTTGAFHRYLREQGDRGQGAMLMDRVDKGQVNSEINQMAARFQRGLHPEGYDLPVNDRILLFGMTGNNASHFSSCTDIALGSLGYAINAATEQKGADADKARALMTALEKLRWRTEITKDGQFRRLGFLTYPKTFKVKSVEKSYATLRQTLLEYATGPVIEPSSAR